MPWYSALFEPGLWAGTGASALAFVGGRVTKRDARIKKLEDEVEECRKRDADWKLLRVGVQVMVEETRRERPNSPALRTMSSLLGQAFGPTPTLAEFQELIGKVDEATPNYEPPFRAAPR